MAKIHVFCLTMGLHQSLINTPFALLNVDSGIVLRKRIYHAA